MNLLHFLMLHSFSLKLKSKSGNWEQSVVKSQNIPAMQITTHIIELMIFHQPMTKAPVLSSKQQINLFIIIDMLPN